MSPVGLLVIYCVLIVLASLLGGWIPLVIRLTHQRLELLVSFVSGVMLGAALLHLLPHAWMERAAWSGDLEATHRWIDPVIGWLLAGFLAMFFVERFFCFHHHDVPDAAAGPGAVPARHDHRLTWTGAAIGLSIHSLIAGVALAASVEAAGDDATTALVGLGVFLAIILHKPFDSMTLGTLMAVGRRTARARHLVNAGFGLVVPAGVILFALGATSKWLQHGPVVSNALAFSAGTFLCISLSDLLPELQFHQHDRAKLSVALLLGIAVAWAAGQAEARAHEEAPGPSAPLLSSLDLPGPIDILIPPCELWPPPSRPFPDPVEGRPRSVHATRLCPSASPSAGPMS